MLHTQRNKNSCCELAENATISPNEFYGLQRVIRRTICRHAGRMHHGDTRPCVTSRGLVDWTIRHIFSETAVAVRAISCFTSPAAPGDPCDSVDGDNGCVVCCDVRHDFTQQILGSSGGAVHLLSTGLAAGNGLVGIDNSGRDCVRDQSRAWRVGRISSAGPRGSGNSKNGTGRSSIVAAADALTNLIQTPKVEISSLVEGIRSGDPRAMARAITAVENRTADGTSLLKALFPLTGRTRTVGITGAPGSGKSTLVDQLARQYRSQQKTVGIIAVDPTSPFSGGAILGDRIRMQEHHSDAGIYIRSMATRGSLGGLAATTADVATVLDASGRDVVLIETVGVGQDEVDIVRLADITIVMLVPGMGDDVQTIKAGIMEIADIFVINKSDREGAERVEREIRAMQSLAARPDQWTPPIVKTVASQGVGTAELSDAIAKYEEYLQKAGLILKKRTRNWHDRLIEMLRDALLQRVIGDTVGEEKIARYAAEVAEHKRDPHSVVEEILGRLEKTRD